MYVSPAEVFNLFPCDSSPDSPIIPVNELETTGATVKSLQAYFTDTLLTYPPQVVNLPLDPQVELFADNFDFITDTAGWTKISGVYTAKGGENKIILGNFKDNINTEYKVFGSINNDTIIDGRNYNKGGNVAYFYIDDVSLVEYTGTSVSENPAKVNASLKPNPASNSFTVQANGEGEIFMYDIIGNLVNKQPLLNGATNFNTSQLSSGMYFVNVVFTNTQVINLKVVVNKQ